MSDVSESLRSLAKVERLWAICSGRSPKMSDHERITQVAHQKKTDEQIPSPALHSTVTVGGEFVVFDSSIFPSGSIKHLLKNALSDKNRNIF